MSTEYPKIETLYERDPKTFKVMTGQLRCPEFGLVDRWLVTEKIDGCLHYSQLVATDRGPLQVGRIVNQRLPVLVASYNLDAGVVEMRPIQHYHKEPRLRPFVAVAVRSRRKGQRQKYVVCTDNHLFFSRGRWVAAADLRTGDPVCHLGDLLTEEARQVILGTLLGDGCIYRPSSTTRGFSFSHSIRQEKYFQFKAGLLQGLFTEGTPKRGGFPGSTAQRRGHSRVTPAVSNLIVSTCEVSGRKSFTPQWAGALLPLALAVLYMDDGSCVFADTQRPRARIAMNGFPANEAKRLVGVLARYGIAAGLFDYNGPTIVMTAMGTERFFSLIAPYVPDCMKYKIPTRYLLMPCVLVESTCEYQGLLDTEVLSVSSTLPARGQTDAAHQYDLSVAGNANYFASGILVHNTNVRVALHADGTVTYGGRTDAAQMPTTLIGWLMEHLPAQRVAAAFDPKTDAVLYGEGYGAGIQKGGAYRPGPGFRLFDVLVLGDGDVRWWLNWSAIEDIAKKTSVPTVPVLFNNVTLKVATDADTVSMPSPAAYEDSGSQLKQEGIVARTEPLLMFRDGRRRLMWKLKGKDL